MEPIQVQEPEDRLRILGYIQVDRPGDPVPCHSCLALITAHAWMAVITYGDGECHLIGPLCEKCANE